MSQIVTQVQGEAEMGGKDLARTCGSSLSTLIALGDLFPSVSSSLFDNQRASSRLTQQSPKRAVAALFSIKNKCCVENERAHF